MAEKKKKMVRKPNVRILNMKYIERARNIEVRVVMKNGATFTASIHATVLDPRRRVVTIAGQPIGSAKSMRTLALLIEDYFKRAYGVEPVAIYPVFQNTLV